MISNSVCNCYSWQVYSKTSVQQKFKFTLLLISFIKPQKVLSILMVISLVLPFCVSTHCILFQNRHSHPSAEQSVFMRWNRYWREHGIWKPHNLCPRKGSLGKGEHFCLWNQEQRRTCRPLWGRMKKWSCSLFDIIFQYFTISLLYKQKEFLTFS